MRVRLSSLPAWRAWIEITTTEQNYHRRSNIYYEYCGISMPLGMIAKLENVKYGMLYSRVRIKGMTVGQALEDIKGGK